MVLTSLERLRLNIRDPYLEFQESQLGDGGSIHFRLSSYPLVADSQQVYKAGVLQAETTDYTITDATGKLTFVSAPGAGVTILVRGQASVFSDTELNDLLAQQDSDVRLATLHALRVLMADSARRERWAANGLESDPRQVVANLKSLYDIWLEDTEADAIGSGGVEEWATEQGYLT